MAGRAVVAIINYGGKKFLGKKRSDSSKRLAGQWHFPGETVEGDETDEQALKRCGGEEIGLEITVGRYLGSHVTPTSHRAVKFYECFAYTDK
jgi:ADP-ribose pyrophosphatase YjhB (NUDIX family)